MHHAIPTVRVLGLQRAEHPHIIAIADIELGHAVVLTGITVKLDRITGHLTIHPPQKSWHDDSGRHYYAPCRFYRPLRKRVLEAILSYERQNGGVR